MGFDIIGWAEATPGTGVVGLTAAAGETLYSINEDDIQLKGDTPYLLGVFSQAASTAGRARLTQPGYSPLYYEFIKAALQEDLDPSQGWHHHFHHPLPLITGQKITASLANATDEQALIGAIVSKYAFQPRVVFPTHIISGYADVTLTANTWTYVAITWNQDLPKGRYRILGMRADAFKAANPMMGLARLLIPGVTNWRPGVPFAVAEADHEEHQSITHTPFNKWPEIPELEFDNSNMPDCEYLSGAANTDENVELLLKKVS